MKIKLCSLLMGVALIAGSHSALAQPSLGILQTNHQSLLYWPSNATGFILQGTTNLSPPNWALVTDAITINYGSQTAVTVTNFSSKRFFRLFQNITSTADGMALIPAGSFTIGDTLDGESDAIPTNVYVSAFYMDTNLVSYGQWKLVYNFATNQGYVFDSAGYGKADNQPVCFTVNWYDSARWCNARSQQASLKPVYYTDAGMTQVYTNGDVDALYPDWSAKGYRLPTEAEWEKAARGGLSGQRFPWGLTISESQANYSPDTETYSYDLGPDGSNTNFNQTGYPYTSPVGYFAPNGYGLYDMAGNLFEWCWDWYATPPYPAGSPYLGGTDPRGPANTGARVQRTGAWNNPAIYIRCCNREAFYPAYGNGSFGFRSVRNF